MRQVIRKLKFEVHVALTYVCKVNNQPFNRGWLGEAKVAGILCHRGVQLILASSWARPAILVAGKGRGVGWFLLFLHFYSCSSFFPLPVFHLLYYLFYLFSPFLWETTQVSRRILWHLIRVCTVCLNYIKLQ